MICLICLVSLVVISDAKSLSSSEGNAELDLVIEHPNLKNSDRLNRIIKLNRLLDLINEENSNESMDFEQIKPKRFIEFKRTLKQFLHNK